MKAIILSIFLAASFLNDVQASTYNISCKPSPILYTYGNKKVYKENYIASLRNSADHYVTTHLRDGRWNSYEAEEFRNAYRRNLAALDDPRKPYRFSTDEFGAITDSEGKFSDNDGDNSWYDDKGNRITNTEYQSLKEKQKKKYHTFEANRQFAAYAKLVLDQTYETEQKLLKKDYPLDY